MTELLPNYLAGQWQQGLGAGTALVDPVLGSELVRVDATGLDLPNGFAFARERGGVALRAMTYRQRAQLLGAAVEVLQTHRDAYYEIATANSGTIKSDSAVDIDGAIFTLRHYARLGDTLGDAHLLLEGGAARLGKDALFQSQHASVPTPGVALFINAFNFPSWGLWEKAAPALLSGVPVIVKPATATAWLAQRMVKDIVDAGVFPPGALSVVCGGSAGLMYALQPFDVVSFTGSAETAGIIRSHPAVARRSVRANIEADSLKSGMPPRPRVHEVEVFGPVATLVPCKGIGDAVALARRGGGSLVTSVYGTEHAALAQVAADLASTNGRVHVVSPDVSAMHTGHGNVMPMSMHGGPGRAGGGEELGGLRALSFYHRRAAIQASQAVLADLPTTTN